MTLPHELEDDVLREIFTHLGTIYPPSWQNSRVGSQNASFSLGWIYVTHVCRHWRVVGIDLATLWAGVVCSLPNTSAMDVLLQRSKGCVLNFEIDSGQAWPYKVVFALEHVQRAESLSCQPTYCWDQALNKRCSLPILRHLAVNQDVDDMNLPRTATLVLDAPQLLYLRLENAFFYLSNPSDILPNLRALELQGPCTLPYPAWELLDLLLKTPQLEHLRLQLLLFRHSQGGLWDQYPGGQVRLVHLKTVTITGGPRADVAGFWSRIYAPDDVDFYASFRADPPSELAAALDRQIRCPSHNTIAVNLARARHLSISTFNLEPKDRSRVILDGGGSATLALLADIESHAQLENMSRFSAQIYIPYTTADEALANLFRKCTSVKEFMLHTDDPDNFAILAPDDGTPILFPSLATLSVQFDSKALKSDVIYRQGWTKLRKILQQRSAAGLRVSTLRLDGRWGWRDAGIEVIDEEMMDDLQDSSLVEKHIDITSNLACNPYHPLIEPVAHHCAMPTAALSLPAVVICSIFLHLGPGSSETDINWDVFTIPARRVDWFTASQFWSRQWRNAALGFSELWD
ncbi:hypothetical protein PENSPDRAFT_694302 [Peniophora sp. CONT]|nr:hypothetical protein PENSPDRAFT_694302 [Peniophora sp. CONT]